MKIKLFLLALVMSLVVFNNVADANTKYSANDIIFSNQKITDITTNSVVLRWDTSMPTSFKLYFQVKNDEKSIYTTVYDLKLIAENPTKSLTHSYKVVNLKENTYYKILVEAIVDDVSTFDAEPWNIKTAKDEALINIPLDTYHKDFEVAEKIESYSESGNDYLVLDWNVGNKLPFSFAYTYKDSGVYYSSDKNCLLDLSCATGKRGTTATSANWRVRLDGLQPGTKYYFRIYADGKLSNNIMEKSTTGTKSNPIPEPEDKKEDNSPDSLPESEKENLDDNKDNNQPISPEIQKLRDRIAKLQYQISQLEQTIINRERNFVKIIDKVLTKRLEGRILLQVEEKGEAWYVDETTEQKFYLKDGDTSYQALKAFGLGISNADLAKIPVGIEDRFEDIDTDNDGLADKLEEALGTNPENPDSDGDGYMDGEEVRGSFNPHGQGMSANDTSLANRLKGKILIQTEGKGEAWYIHPENGKRYYMKDGAAAYQIMRFLSLGITNNDLRKIDVGSFE